uniref:Ataxin-2 homolog isoform X1 n=1 Tax=Drosophila rhopaloa TaxID=1041015 RepID=A0A6P4EJK9_DRORH
MAATPPMPPGSNTHQLNGKPVGKGNPLTEAINQHFQRKNQTQNQNPNPSKNPKTNSPGSRNGSNEQLELLEHPPHPQQEATSGKSKPSCNCTNISIMHLFHEMKQEFPTIPDAMLTQCVNENCHQRENCIQMLRKELALHPIPVQSYPAKVLQQQQQNHNRQAKPPTPLKPSRVAPPHPELGQSNGEATPPSVFTPHPNPQARPRPTTLNLQRQFSTQLQQKIQQRQQRQQNDHQPPQLTPTSLSKPLRRAPPLPPPPKPKPGSFSNDSSCLTSPMSSSESELSLNAVSLSSPTPSAARVAGASTAIAPVQQQPSPVRHRSVITLQPEPPYARDFRSSDFLPPTTTSTPPLPSPNSAASPGAAGGRKSFTSLNLTLRQPTGSAQSAIDITAGPAPSGQGSGITYSSVSFDARRGTHKNFQLTVTDEGSVFSAGCIRPRRPYAAACEPVSSVPANHQPPAPAAVVADGLGDPEMSTDVFPYPTQEQNHIVASNYSNNYAVSNNNNNSGISSSVDSSPTMPLYEGVLEECDREVHAATIERQKKRRDKLANALRDNKKKLLVLEQEINILTEPVPLGESERLDRDIMQLTEDCNRLLDCIYEPQAAGPGPAANSMSRQHPSPGSNAPQQQQPQPQPFPRQRQGARTQAPPNSLRLHSVPAAPTSQPSLDFGQHHSSAPTSACLTPQQQSQQQHFQLQHEPPPTYAEYYQFQQYLQQQRQQIQEQQLRLQQQVQQQPPPQQEEEFLSDSDVDEEEEPMDSWACNMCTFRNHPQLNICEACENVRIQPGMIRIVPTGSGAAAAATPPGSLEQQQQPPQQPYALHT